MGHSCKENCFFHQRTALPFPFLYILTTIQSCTVSPILLSQEVKECSIQQIL